MSDSENNSSENVQWRHRVLADRVRALAGVRPEHVRLQPVAADHWRVIDAAASWDDPAMLIGFVEHTAAGYECMLMAEPQRVSTTPSLGTARSVFMNACGTRRWQR